MSDLQNYKIIVLAGAVTEVNFSLISLLRDNICFFSMVFYLFLPIPHQVGTCILIQSPQLQSTLEIIYFCKEEEGQCALDGKEIACHLESRLGSLLLRRCQREGRSARLKSLLALVFRFRFSSK